MPNFGHVYRLGVKELWGLRRDWILLILIGYAFTLDIYVAATAVPDGLANASIGIVDEDRSPLSERIATAFFPPMFKPPFPIDMYEMDRGMDLNLYTFVLDIPPHFQRDVLAGRSPRLQLNVDATMMSDAFTGASYIQEIVGREILTYLTRTDVRPEAPVDLTYRNRFNPNLTQSWFGAITEIINQVTMLSIILTGAALIREREHGTLEHLLVMPVTPTEIMLSKVWAMGLVVILATCASIAVVVERALAVPIRGSVLLFLAGTGLHLFATTSMGICLATMARSMPQFGMLLILVLLPLQLLSGGATPRESMPANIQYLMLAAPTTHYVQIGQAILFRGAGLEAVWEYFAALLVIGGILFVISLSRFRKSLS